MTETLPLKKTLISQVAQDAIDFATIAHAGQYRKDGKTPYVSHPIAVAKRLETLGVTDANILKSALLHDTIEDTDVTYDDILAEFGIIVAVTVQELSLAPKDSKGRRPRGHSKRDYENNFYKASSSARLIKLADRAHNMQTMKDIDPEYAPKYAVGTLRLVASCMEKSFPAEYQEAARTLATEIVIAAMDYLSLDGLTPPTE